MLIAGLFFLPPGQHVNSPFSSLSENLPVAHSFRRSRRMDWLALDQPNPEENFSCCCSVDPSEDRPGSQADVLILGQ